ncbi:MAG: peptide chain release factor N(5)-glutamine methyltransferase [Anaerolineales bacterium]|nr:peptide chain release factor N(5)-glutamine methyltransferase [Anaerolineales bacterium]
MKPGENTSIINALEQAQNLLAGKSDSPNLDSQVWLGKVLGKDRIWMLTHQEELLSVFQWKTYQDGFQRLSMGYPLPYLLGEWEFYGMTFLVTPEVLIPRPETELLVATALGWLQTHPGRHLVGEIGCGSGCIPGAIAHHQLDVRIISSDISLPACQIALKNIERLAVNKQVAILQADLLPAKPASLDLLISNPPYIPEGKLSNLKVTAHEPRLALDGGEDGLRIIERILHLGKTVLRPSGMILIEIEAGQGNLAADLGRRIFPEPAFVEVKPDLAGLPRLLVIQT